MDRVAGTINGRGNITRNLYDARHRQLNTVNALGHVAGQTLDTEGNMPTRADGLGNITSFLYDALNRQTATIDAVGNRTTSLLDATDNVLEVKNALSKVTTFQYDLLSRVTLTKDALLNQTNTYYDAMSNVTQVTDARSKITRYSFDALNRLTVTTNADSKTQITYFDPVGNVTGTRDWRGNLTEFQFDALDRQTVVIDADTKRTTTLFDAAGNMTGVQNARGKLTEFLYDALNRQTVVVDAAGGRTTTLFDPAGNVTGVLNARNQLTQLVFDAAERQTVSVNSEGYRTSSVLDAAGNTDAVTDPLNYTTQYQQDALNRNTVTIDPRLAGYRTSVLFDAVGNVTQITDAQNGYNNVTTFGYDALNRRTRETDPLGVKTWDYDEVGNVTTTTDRLSRRRDFKYDNLNRVTTQIWFTSSTPVETLTYSFDENSNVTRGARETNSSATHSITYDVLNRATVLDKPYGVRVTNVFDEVSNRTEFRDSLGGIQTNVYDPVDRLTITKFTGQGLEVRYDQGYYETHELKSIHRYTKLDGTELRGRTSYILDTRNRLENLEHFNAAGTRFAYYTYTYDNANRLTSEVRNTTTRNFVYDEAGQLTTDGPLSHSYDGTGNRTDTAQHQTVAGNRLTNDGLWTYTYDFEGNLEKKSKGDALDTWKYFYDHNNQLTRVERRDADDTSPLTRDVQFKYDAFGQRIEKIVDLDGAGGGPAVTTRFACDGENVFADFDGGTPPSLTTRYLRGDVIDQIFARIGAPGGATELNWLLTDRQGSIREVRNASGGAIRNVDYDGFGNVLGTAPSELGRYTWTGRERDVEIDLQYNRARYYDPATGRWIHRDPLGFDAGDSNLYRYVNNGPTNGTDPSGMYVWAADVDVAKDFVDWLNGVGNRTRGTKNFKTVPLPKGQQGNASYVEEGSRGFRIIAGPEILDRLLTDPILSRKGSVLPSILNAINSGETHLVLSSEWISNENLTNGAFWAFRAKKAPFEVRLNKIGLIEAPRQAEFVAQQALLDHHMNRVSRQRDAICEIFVPQKTAHIDPAVRFRLQTEMLMTEFRGELEAIGKLLNYGSIALQLGVGLYNWWNPGGWYLIYRGIEGIASEITGEERWSTQFGRYVGGESGANIAHYGLTVLDLAVAWRLSRMPEVQGAPRPPAITAPTNRGGLRAGMGQPPGGLANPQAHHDLPWTLRDWFAGEGRGLNVNDPAHGRWVSGTPPGGHQRWTAAFEAQWRQFINRFPNATREQVLEFMNELRANPAFQ